jgi:hypothetical protein
MIRHIVGCKLSLGCVGLLLLFGVSAHRASGQVSFPGLHSDPHLSFFGTFTNLKPDYQYYGDYAAVGVTSGVFMQTSHILGWEGRASINRWQGLEHQEAALVGPRAALHFGRISPYVCFFGGVANGWRWQTPRLTGQPEPRLIEGFGPQWSTGRDQLLENVPGQLESNANQCKCRFCLSTQIDAAYTPGDTDRADGSDEQKTVARFLFNTAPEGRSRSLCLSKRTPGPGNTHH